ncbi:hypothetical protein F4604DRAFT_1929213 [Suillus subluteus]|nr:hypothetical protein F4604DRAFT_1929213 [Suillus subluteus]
MFYFSDGTHIFRIGDSLFKVHASILGDKSLGFRDMFAASQDTQLEEVDGSADDKPIFVPLQVSENAFELFLSMEADALKIPNDTVIQLLELSDMYLCKDAPQPLLTQINTTYLKYNIKDFLPHAFECLVSACINDISDDECHAVGPIVWNTMFKVKERLDVHRRIIACEAPPMVHTGTCTKQKRFKEDWKQLWWNGMGRFLLDGRNPQPYKDAVERFEKLDIGEINPDCWKAVLFIVKGQSAFDHERKLITRTADNLAKYLIVEPNFEDFGCAVY